MARKSSYAFYKSLKINYNYEIRYMTKNVQNSSDGFGYMDFLIMVDDCTLEDEQKLRSELHESMRDIFDNLTDIRRKILTTFSKLDGKQLEIVKKMADGKYLVGLHDLNNLLSVFMLISEKES